MPFQDVFGHERQIGLLRKALDTGNISHAYLFYGPEGVGKRRVALNFAQALNCEHKTDDACGHCRSCRNIERGNHPDFLVLQPDEGLIRIEEIRNIQRVLGYKAYENGWKIALVDGCEDMLDPAANCFLKTLEEPPDRTVIILICSNYLSLLPTINSRCRKIRFSPLQAYQIQDILIREKGYNSEMAGVLSVLADGSIGKALSMDYETVVELRSLALDLLREGRQKKIADLFALSRKFDKKKREARELLYRMRGLIRDIVVFAVTGDENFIKNRDIADSIANISEKRGPEACQRIFALISETLNSLQRNANIPLALDNLFIQLRELS